MKIPSINFSKQTKALERLISQNAPTILTGLGVVGVAATSYLTYKAATTGEAMLVNERSIENAKRTADEPYNTAPFTAAERFAKTWKLYVPAAFAGLATCTCIVGANRISAKRAAALAGLLALTQDDLRDYKDKVREKMTGPAHKKLTEERDQEKMYQVVERNATFPVADGDVLCIEEISMRPFSCNKNKLQRAENDINKRILQHDAASLSEFYDMVGLEHTAISGEMGWNTGAPLELDFAWTGTPDGRPAMLVKYVDHPTMRPWEAGSFQYDRR